MNDGTSAYKFRKTEQIGNNSAFYISQQLDEFYYQNKKKNGNIHSYDIKNTSLKNNIISFYYDGYPARNYSKELETKTSPDELGKLVRNNDVFDDMNEYMKQMEISEASANSIEEEIETRKQKLKDFRENIEKTLKENLFADPSFKSAITGNIDEVQKGLENASDHLGAQKKRYSHDIYNSMLNIIQKNLEKKNEQ